MTDRRVEPVVRVRAADPADAARCRAILARAGLTVEESLTWLVVRGEDPDVVNDALVAGGAHGRAVVRERIGQLVGWVIDRQGDLAGRERNVRSLVERVLSDGGLKDRYAPRPDAELVPAARALWARVVEEGAPLLAWRDFADAFCLPR